MRNGQLPFVTRRAPGWIKPMLGVDSHLQASFNKFRLLLHVWHSTAPSPAFHPPFIFPVLYLAASRQPKPGSASLSGSVSFCAFQYHSKKGFLAGRQGYESLLADCLPCKSSLLCAADRSPHRSNHKGVFRVQLFQHCSCCRRLTSHPS